MNITIHCDRCGETIEYFFRDPPNDWSDWYESATVTAEVDHETRCPPRRGAYRKALGLDLRIGRPT